MDVIEHDLPDWRCECGDLNRRHEAFCYRCGAVQPEAEDEVISLQQLRGAVEALRKIAEGEVPLGQWGELSQAMQRFAADAWNRAGGQ